MMAQNTFNEAPMKAISWRKATITNAVDESEGSRSACSPPFRTDALRPLCAPGARLDLAHRRPGRSIPPSRRPCWSTKHKRSDSVTRRYPSQGRARRNICKYGGSCFLVQPPLAPAAQCAAGLSWCIGQTGPRLFLSGPLAKAFGGNPKKGSTLTLTPRFQTIPLAPKFYLT
jgi:hypothetical protein